MDPLRRFEKIEGAREEREPKEPQEPAELPRFEEPPAPRAEAAPPPGPVTEQTMESLILTLPTLECPACNTDNSKFSKVCRSCQHPLDGADALAHNARRLELREVDRLKAEIEMERQLARLEAPAAKHVMAQGAWTLPPPPSARLTAWLAGGLVLVALLTRSSSFSTLCVLGALGLGAWRLLGPRKP